MPSNKKILPLEIRVKDLEEIISAIKKDQITIKKDLAEMIAVQVALSEKTSSFMDRVVQGLEAKSEIIQIILKSLAELSQLNIQHAQHLVEIGTRVDRLEKEIQNVG